MFKPAISMLVGLAAVSSLGACNLLNPSSLVNAVAGAAGFFSGKIYAPGTQVAIVAQGGGNLVGNSGGTYDVLLVRSDEVGVPNAVVKATDPKGATITGATDDTGNFRLQATSGVTYHVVGTFTSKAGDTVTVNGFGQVDAVTPMELGVAHNMLASKLLSSGISNPDYSAFKAALVALETDLQSVSTTPAPTDQASAATAFDANASSNTKGLEAAIKNVQ